MIIKAIKMQWIINGSPTVIKANLKKKLGEIAKEVLAQSGNSGRPYPDWQCRDSNGVLLEMDRTLSDFEFKPGVRLFLNLAVGVGGAAA